MSTALAALQGRDSLHEGQDSMPSLDRSQSIEAKEFATQLQNRNLANIRIDDSQLERNLANILDRLSATEVRLMETLAITCSNIHVCAV